MIHSLCIADHHLSYWAPSSFIYGSVIEASVFSWRSIGKYLRFLFWITEIRIFLISVQTVHVSYCQVSLYVTEQRQG